MSYLITASLLNSWQWYLQNESPDAEREWLQTLNREQIPDNDKLLNGRAFECRVRLVNEPKGDWLTDGDREDLEKTQKKEDNAEYMDTVREVAGYTQGGLWQMPVNMPCTINGTGFLLYGRLDVMKLGILDVKFSGTYEHNKYLDNPQLRMYMTIVQHAPWMQFIVSDGKRVYQDYFERQDVEPVFPLVADFWNWVSTYPKYRNIFTSKWVSIETRR